MGQRRAVALVVITRGGAELAAWPLKAARAPDLAVVSDLARLQLAARRAGCAIELREMSSSLAGLLELCGLSAVLPASPWRPGSR